ncbi:MAG: N-acetylmuramoyl-L-alanine amidase [Bacillus sp. (in: firmicutes)]
MTFEILTAVQLIERLKGRKYKYSQIHHTWKPNHASFTGKNHLALQQGMYDYHVKTRGWDNIGQHVTLMPDGTFVTGRPFDKTPAGISGYNTGAFMVEMLGDFDEGCDKLEGAQLDAMLKLQHFLTTECGAAIMFHREHAPKTCPGTGLDKAAFLKQVANYGVPSGLKTGDNGAEVKKYQEYLLKVGEKLPKFGADGDYGQETIDAVKSFQVRNKLTADGVLGAQTKAKLEEAVKPKPAVRVNVITGWYNEGSKGLAELEAFLNSKGWHYRKEEAK